MTLTAANAQISHKPGRAELEANVQVGHKPGRAELGANNKICNKPDRVETSGRKADALPLLGLGIAVLLNAAWIAFLGYCAWRLI